MKLVSLYGFACLKGLGASYGGLTMVEVKEVGLWIEIMENIGMKSR